MFYEHDWFCLWSDVPEGCVIVREHVPISNLFACLWFNEVDRFTPRDQISFAIVRDKIWLKSNYTIDMFLDCERRNFVIQVKGVIYPTNNFQKVSRFIVLFALVEFDEEKNQLSFIGSSGLLSVYRCLKMDLSNLLTGLLFQGYHRDLLEHWAPPPPLDAPAHSHPPPRPSITIENMKDTSPEILASFPVKKAGKDRKSKRHRKSISAIKDTSMERNF